jgi:predicted secreted Zn-dependent protease
MSALSFHCSVFALIASALVTSAQTVRWTTNFYSVTGANFREIRQSITQSRPWAADFDGDTRWKIEWRFNTVETANGCVCTGFGTTTTITTTMPRWTPPTNASPELKQQWTRYYTNLAQHEIGHARLGLAAANEVGKKIAEVTAQPDCTQLKNIVNERAEKVVEDYRAREREYDHQTDHGRMRTDGPPRFR